MGLFHTRRCKHLYFNNSKLVNSKGGKWFSFTSLVLPKDTWPERKRARALFPIALRHNLIFIDTGDECDSSFFKVNLVGGVYEAHGEDFSFEPLRLPVHSAGWGHHGCLGQGLRCFWARWSALLGKVISRRRPCPPEWALSSVEAILNGQGLYDKNRPCPKRLQTLPDMPEEMAHSHGPTVTCPQTKTPRMAAKRLERKTRLELFLVIY